MELAEDLFSRGFNETYPQYYNQEEEYEEKYWIDFREALVSFLVTNITQLAWDITKILDKGKPVPGFEQLFKFNLDLDDDDAEFDTPIPDWFITKELKDQLTKAGAAFYFPKISRVDKNLLATYINMLTFSLGKIVGDGFSVGTPKVVDKFRFYTAIYKLMNPVVFPVERDPIDDGEFGQYMAMMEEPDNSRDEGIDAYTELEYW